jgi:hypothetical protein
MWTPNFVTFCDHSWGSLSSGGGWTLRTLARQAGRLGRNTGQQLVHAGIALAAGLTQLTATGWK